MLLAALRQRNTTLADLARVLACWLVVVLLVQGFAALQATAASAAAADSAAPIRVSSRAPACSACCGGLANS
jgi:hypothetical protein